MRKNLVSYLESHVCQLVTMMFLQLLYHKQFPWNFVITNISVVILHDLNRHLIKLTHLTTFIKAENVVSCELEFLRMQMHGFLRNSLNTKENVYYTFNQNTDLRRKFAEQRCLTFSI